MAETERDRDRGREAVAEREGQSYWLLHEGQKEIQQSTNCAGDSQ